MEKRGKDSVFFFGLQTVEGQKKKLEEHEQLLSHRRYGDTIPFLASGSL